MRGFTATTLSNELVSPNSSGAASTLQELIADQKKELEKVPMIIEAVETIFPQFARQGESAKPPVKKRKNYPVVVVVLTNTFVR